MSTTTGFHGLRSPARTARDSLSPLTLSLSMVVCIAMLMLWAPLTVQAQDTYVVNSTADAPDATDNGTCATSGGACTLRAAIEEANNDADRDNISFEDIPTTGGFATISLNSELPVTEEIGIDGSTAPGYPSASANGPIVKIDGSNISGSAEDGFDFFRDAASSRVVGLAVVNMPDEGIQTFVDNVTIRECFVGVDVDGTTVQGNIRDSDGSADGGISIASASGVTVNDNLVSGNQGTGIFIDGNDNTVINNIVGLDHNEDAAKANAGNGVHVASGTGNLIGNAFQLQFGTPFFNGNTIAGNDGAGVLIQSNDNDVFANLIGNNGVAAFPNSTGVVIEGATNSDIAENNEIGSGDDIDRNTISGNDFPGIRLGNGSSNGGAADNNTVNNNIIGLNTSADAAVPNGNGCNEAGIRIDLGTNNTMTNNVIAGNTGHGVFIRGGSSSSTNTVASNHIGTNSNFGDFGNTCTGIRITTNANMIGGIDEADGNVIGYNADAGIRISDNGNGVLNNHVGTNANGADLGNGGVGVFVSGNDNSIGLLNTGNTIGNNIFEGIGIENGSNNVIEGNHIGTTANGDAVGNGKDGIIIRATSGNSATGNEVGFFYNESIPSAPSTDDGLNVIANNDGDGVDIKGGGTATGNSVRGNRIYANTELGIDLAGGTENSDGATDNDNASDDGDTGPNHLQNYPVINDINLDEQNEEVTIDYTVFTSSANANYGSNGLKVDFYADTDPSNPESRTYLDTQLYNAPSSSKQVVIALPPGVSSDDYFVATVTDADGNTSELSAQPTPLPVELVTFKGTATDEAVQLTWRTASEQSNAGFEIQRRRGTASSWTQIGFVDGHGTTSAPHRYSFKDADFSYEADSLAYRLKQIDTDGSATLSREVEIALSAPEQLALHGNYPNPFRSQTTIRYEVPQATQVELSVYDLLGRRVATLVNEKQDAGRQQIQFNASALSSGVYFVRLSAEGTTRTQKLTVVR